MTALDMCWSKARRDAGLLVVSTQGGRVEPERERGGSLERKADKETKRDKNQSTGYDFHAWTSSSSNRD